jgi:error-prone DNA polymerase
MSFVHLHVHSHYSFLRGADSVADLALAAQRHDMPALAITDRNGLYGVIPFQNACDDCGIKPIFGAQLVTESVSCVALVKDGDGYASLCRAITALQLHQTKGDFDLATHLANDRTGLIVFSRDVAFLEQLQNTSGPRDLYIEVLPGTPRRSLKEAQRRTELPLVASNNVWFVYPEDYTRHRLLTAIGQNTFLDSIPPGETAGERHYLKSPAEMAGAFSDIPEAIENTQRIADVCNHRILLGVLRLPKFPFTDGRPAFDVLRDKTEAGLVRRYGVVSDAVRRQVERELDIIREMRYADYFLIVSDIVDAAKARRIPTCGRGSAANSVVAYALELTHVEPLSHNLYFERFLNRGRSDCPDVDIDFSWRDRDRVIDWVYERYGRDRVAMIATHVTFAARGSVREIAKVMGVPPPEITRITKRLPSGWGTGSIAAAMKNDPRAHGLPADREPWKTIFAMAGQLNGFPKHLGIHAGGIVIAPSPLTDHLPLQPAAKETDAGHVVVTQWDMYPVEDMGLVKIDLLGNRSLAVIDDAVLAVKDNTGTVIDYTRFNPITDRKTKNIIRRGETMGCFYVESPSMRNLLRKLDCLTFDGLVAASSIIRPGIASSGMMQAYIERFHHVRRHGTHDPEWYLHPQMRQALAETYGVMAYQEDVLKVAESIAGMSPEDSDGLRKAMSKKRDFVAIERYRRQFVGGAIANGCARDVAQELWRQIESFSGYSFCKAHSASFALVSYQAAYLRAHHPAEFMAAVLSNYGGYYATFAYISEAKRMGLRILLPCVNRSEYRYTGADDWIRIGLIQIQSIHHQRLAQLLKERDRNGPFADLADFVRRVPILSHEVEILIRAGAFDAIAQGKNRPELLRQLIMLCAGPGQHHGVNRFQSTLFPDAQLPEIAPSRDYDWRHVLACEAECIGFTASAHPLDLYTQKLQRYTITKANELEKRIGRTVTLVGWQVTRKRLRTRQDEPMVFITFEDTHGLYETVIFPREYRRLASLTMNAGPFVVRGEVTEEYGALTVTVKDMRLLTTDRDGAQQTHIPGRPEDRRNPARSWIRAA